MISLLETPELSLFADEKSGAVVSFRLFDRELLAENSGPELLVNGAPLDLRVAPPTWTNIAPYPQNLVGAAQNEMHGTRFLTHYTGFAFDVSRAVKAITPREVRLAYTLQRAPIRALYDTPGPGWGALEAPLRADGFTLPCWNWNLWGDDTQMLALNPGNSGPACHLGFENGPLEAVKATINHPFRRQYCGNLGFPGAVFSDRKSENWLAISCRRPRLAYQLDHQNSQNGVAFEFLPLKEVALGELFALPEIAFHFGRTQREMREFLARFLSTFYEEPPTWASETTWFELSLGREFFPDWNAAHRAALQLTENGAVSGLHLIQHERQGAFGGTSPLGLGPNTGLGGRKGFEAMTRDLKARGVRLLCWMTTCGLTPGGDADPDWFIKGSDGQPLCAWGLPHHPDMFYLNTLHPGYRAYVEKWLRYYLGELGFDGAFFDCAGFPYPPDFAPREWMRFPSDTLLGNVLFFDWVRDLVREINPDAMVFNEGNCLDAPCHALLLNANAPAQNDGMGQRDFLLDLHNFGGKRFAIRSDRAGDLASGMVNVAPWTNHGLNADDYARVGRDEWNIALTTRVRGGIKGAKTLATGVSRSQNWLCVDEGAASFYLPEARLKNTQTGAVLEANEGRFTLSERGIWEIVPL